MVAQLRGHLGQAEGWYKKSLAIKEALGNQPGMADHGLSSVVGVHHAPAVFNKPGPASRHRSPEGAVWVLSLALAHELHVWGQLGLADASLARIAVPSLGGFVGVSKVPVPGGRALAVRHTALHSYMFPSGSCARPRTDTRGNGQGMGKEATGDP